jgi:hypothetical protein
MKAPASDAEALRGEQAAQVRAPHRFLMAADEFCDFIRRHQSVRESTRREQSICR